jgi:microcystin-dependent protein
VTRGWLTDDTIPTDTTCRVLLIPNSEAFIAIVTGALNSLVEEWNYESYGLLTPNEMADAFVPMFDGFCLGQGFCRMVGEIVPFAGSVSPFPTQWLLCNGDSLLRSDYSDLFSVVGTSYGSTDSSHFNLPDLSGRTPIMAGSGLGLTARALGDSFGEESHQLSVVELASHVHTAGNSLLIGTQIPPPLDGLGPNPLPAYTGSTGGDVAHNNMQPSLAISFFIVARN